jgi:UDP-2,3-diacylglucosamine pyrophosphatase LpxH
VRLGSWSYDLLIKLNLFLNTFAKWFNKDRFSLAQRVKMKFKSAVTFISKFEENIVGIAAEKDFDGVIVGHIHIPQIKNYKVNDKNIQYLNSGDCVENGTALEYHNCQWHLVYFAEKVQNKGN